jgi:hypothetical protein
MAEIIDLMDFRNLGNGAREALIDIMENEDDTDIILTELWIRGFKIVPLEPDDAAVETLHA